MLRPARHRLVLLILALLATPGLAPAAPVKVKTLRVTDTLQPQRDDKPDTQKMLDALSYRAAAFDVKLTTEEGPWDALVYFPSPKPRGEVANDRVVLEWHAACDPQTRETIDGPAVLILHHLGGNMALPRIIAQGLNQSGIHAFVIHLPGYGLRRTTRAGDAGATFLSRAIQGGADSRRARDVIAALPRVKGPVGIQGTSLGGFVTTAAAAIDGAFNPVFITLAGGNLYDMFINGEREAARIRARLERAGYRGERLRELAWQIEPLRIAHRLDPKRTWLFSAAEDQVVPPRNAKALADAAKLGDHQIWLSGDHITVAANLPWFLMDMVRKVKAAEAAH